MPKISRNFIKESNQKTLAKFSHPICRIKYLQVICSFFVFCEEFAKTKFKKLKRRDYGFNFILECGSVRSRPHKS